VKRHNQPIHLLKPSRSIDSGITFEGSIPGIVSPFQEVEACNASNYQYFGDWQDLNNEQKSFLTAHFFLTTIVENHREEAKARAAERESKKKSKGGGGG
jgi:hypothetical protein